MTCAIYALRLSSVRRSILGIMLLAWLSPIAAPIAFAVESDLSRRPLAHEDYDVWNTIATTSMLINNLVLDSKR
jgi:hypothetical protein